MEQGMLQKPFQTGFRLFRALAGLAVNYTIYYCRRFILFESIQKARRLTDKQYRLHRLHSGACTYNEYITASRDAATVKGNIPIEPKGSFTEGDLTEDNLHVNALWIGSKLSKIELLTIFSFANCGHIFHLWTYEKLNYDFPAGVVIEDANKIIPFENVFRYKHANKYGHGKGSVSGFSDIFRYKLLYEKGGWWTDMDVTCLRPLNFTEPYFFRLHHELEMVGNVMKCPPQSALMLACYTEAVATVDENNTNWHKPIEILNKYVAENNLQLYIYKPVSNLDVWSELVGFAIGNKPIPAHFRIIHWMNEEWRSREIDKNKIRYTSTLGKLMVKAGLIQITGSRWLTFKNNITHLVMLRIFYL